MESGQVPEKWDLIEYWKGGIRASIGEGFGRVPKKWNSGEYRRRVDLGEYQKGRIRASARKVESGRV